MIAVASEAKVEIEGEEVVAMVAVATMMEVEVKITEDEMAVEDIVEVSEAVRVAVAEPQPTYTSETSLRKATEQLC